MGSSVHTCGRHDTLTQERLKVKRFIYYTILYLLMKYETLIFYIPDIVVQPANSMPSMRLFAEVYTGVYLCATI